MLSEPCPSLRSPLLQLIGSLIWAAQLQVKTASSCGHGGLHRHLSHSLFLTTSFRHSPTVSALGSSSNDHPHQGPEACQRSMLELQGIVFTELSPETHAQKWEQAMKQVMKQESPRPVSTAKQGDNTATAFSLAPCNEGTSQGTAGRSCSLGKHHGAAHSSPGCAHQHIQVCPDSSISPLFFLFLGQNTHLSVCHSICLQFLATCSQSPKKHLNHPVSRKAMGVMPSTSHSEGFAVQCSLLQSLFPMAPKGSRAPTQPPAPQQSRRYLQSCTQLWLGKMPDSWMLQHPIGLYSLIQRSNDSCLCLQWYL